MKKKQVDAVSGKYSEKKQRNSIKNKKTLEIVKKILYNIPCVKENKFNNARCAFSSVGRAPDS